MGKIDQNLFNRIQSVWSISLAAGSAAAGLLWFWFIRVFHFQTLSMSAKTFSSVYVREANLTESETKMSAKKMSLSETEQSISENELSITEYSVSRSVPCIIVTDSAVCSFPPFPCPPCLAVDPAWLKGNRFYFTNSRETKLINQFIERCPPLLHSLQTPPFSRVFQNMKKFCTGHRLFKNFKNIPSFKKKCLVLPLEVYTVNIAL